MIPQAQVPYGFVSHDGGMARELLKRGGGSVDEL